MHVVVFGLLRNLKNKACMIVIRIEGGLGNQMFQYAFGKSLALETKSKLLIDLIHFENQNGKAFIAGVSKRKFELEVFPINFSIWHNSICNFFPISLNDRLKLKLEKIIGIKAIIYEEKYGYNEDIILKLAKNNYFYGYWQSPKYFEKNRTILLDDFKFKFPENRNIDLENVIQSCNAVSIHVRRGDYVNSEYVNKIHGICTIEYYKMASEIMFNKFLNIRWFIFSDDINWCKDNFTWLKNVEFINSYESPAYYDMYLMSICKHNIIANSSFSWWGAWLNQNNFKTVIGPSKWFADSRMNDQISGILPSSWISI